MRRSKRRALAKERRQMRRLVDEIVYRDFERCMYEIIAANWTSWGRGA